MALPTLPDSRKVNLLMAHRELIVLDNQRKALVDFVNKEVSSALTEAKLDENDFGVDINSLQFVEKQKPVEVKS